MCQTSNTATQVCVGKPSLECVWDKLFDRECREWIAFTPALGLDVYPCYSCKVMFSSGSSFRDHINRRAVLLKYSCPDCSETYTFYNRCSFLMHARTHFTLEEGTIRLSSIEVSSLPVGLGGFLPHPDIPQLYTDEERDVGDDVYINTQFYYPTAEERGKDEVVLKPIEIHFGRNADGVFTLGLQQKWAKTPRCVFVGIEHQNRLKSQPGMVQEPSMLCEVQIKEEPVDDFPIISKIETIRNGGKTIQNGPTSPMDVKPTDLKCLECNKIPDKPMADHFIGENQPYNEALSCKVCKFIAPTECSYSAHKRMHDYLPPFVCPECGKIFRDFNELRLHMDEVCFHLVKSIRYKCNGRNCGKLFAMPATYYTHFESHMQVLMQCSLCKETFLQESDFHTHIPTHNQPCTLIKAFKCQVCTNLTGSFNEINAKEHIQWHVRDRKRCMYVYMCRNCRSYFRSTATYIVHAQRCVKNPPQPIVRSVKPTGEPMKYTRSNCQVCHATIMLPENAQGVGKCSKCKNGLKTMKCGGCGELVMYRDGASSSVCNGCNKVNFMPQEKRPEGAGIPKKFFCILCNKQLLKHEKAQHTKECKYASPVVVIEKLELKSEIFSDEECPLVPEVELTEEPPRKRVRRPPYKAKSAAAAPPPPPEVDELADSPTANGLYRCRLCYHREKSREEFHRHILRHRDIQTLFQCMECGECFVVKPSLVKHLQHYHHVENVEEYIQNNDCYDHEAVRELAENMRLVPGEAKNVKENQCRVCREEFPDKTSHDKHFRIHGMAFLLKKTAN